jgi:cell division protein FtsI (penicillin-binding protein 3)
MKPATAHEIGHMLELAASERGTGAAARVARYRVAGKTGTVHKIGPGGYSPDRYVSIFAGYAPVSDPRLVAVVFIDEPERGGYFGGEVAAPVFAKVMDGALRLLNIAPDGTGATVATDDRAPGGGGHG